MTDDPFRRFRCWSTGEVQRTIFGDIAWLGLDADAVFLAAHTSLEIEQVRGVQQPGAEREVAVLRSARLRASVWRDRTLSSRSPGPSGSGKSHLVRWVRAQLSETADSYHLIYVPKALETLRQLLGHILDRMPGEESDAVKAELDKAVGQKAAGAVGRRVARSSALGSRLRASGGEAGTRRGDEEFPARHARRQPRRHDAKAGSQICFLVKPVRDHLLRPDGAIARMVDSVRGQRRG